MYYMKNKLNMKWMAALFAVAAIISSFDGNMPQVNSIAASEGYLHRRIVTGAVLVLLGLIILGGIKNCSGNRKASTYDGHHLRDWRVSHCHEL